MAGKTRRESTHEIAEETGAGFRDGEERRTAAMIGEGSWCGDDDDEWVDA